MARIPVLHKIAIAGLVAAGAVFLCRDLAMPRTVSLTLDARVDTPQELRLLYDDGTKPGFDAAKSLIQSVNVTGRFSRLRFDIHAPQLKGLWLDFQSRQGRIALENIRLDPKGPLAPEAFARGVMHQIGSFTIEGATAVLSFDDRNPYVIFDRRDVETPARRRTNLPLTFSILVLAYLFAFRALDWMTWEQPRPVPAPPRPASARGARRLAGPDGLFLLALAAFSCYPASRIDTHSVVSKENRRLEAYHPLVQDAQVNTQYGNQFEAWFSDRFRNRFAVIQLHRSLMNLLDRPENSEVFSGADGWLFYQSKAYGDPIADFIGNNHHPEAFKQQAAAQVRQARDALQARGIRLVLMIPPNKELIHAPHFGARLRQAQTFSRTDDLVAHLRQHAGVPIVYPKQELLDLSDRYELYHKSDSHWNALGAFVAEQQLLDVLYGTRQRLEDQAIVKTTNVFPDLANMLSIAPAGYSYALAPASMKPYRRSARNMELCHNPDAPHDATLMLVGDSFRNALNRFLLGDFRHTYVLHRRDFKSAMLSEIRPDILVLEYVERNSFEIGALPPFLLETEPPSD